MGTKTESYGWITLDEERLTKLDVESDVDIGKSGRKLELVLRDEAKFSLAESGGKIFVNNYSLSEKGGFSTNLDNIYSCSIAEKRRQGGLGGIDVLVCYRSNEPDGLNYYYMATAR